MIESDDETVNENNKNQSPTLTKLEKEIEVAEVVSKIENGSLELYRSNGISPAWKKFMKIRDTASKERIHYAQCMECKALLWF